MLPDFTFNGYQVIEELQQNVQGGRITYKAIEIDSQKPVIIKQFSFATKTWDGYKEIEREIKVLQGLNHDGIPKFLDKFDLDNGLCLVQEYKNAQPLSEYRSFSPEEIKNIAVQLLEILVYLQKRIPPIIHRDIKPENVLIDENINVYLIDFGLARIGNNTMALSSIVGGTFGFMPPEQIHNQKLTEASDLYGLGATLICLITQTKSANIGELVDFSTNKINFKNRVPKYSFKFVQWLEKMVKPSPNQRFQNAEEALNALKPVYVIRVPEVKLNILRLNIEANKLNEKISQIIIITNKIPDTILQGKWSVSPHPKDPPHTPDHHNWISFYPQQFEGNLVKCVVTINTRKLKADSNYKREIVLTTNAKQENYCVKVNLKTAPIQLVSVPMPPYLLLLVSGVVLTVYAQILTYGWLWINANYWGVMGLTVIERAISWSIIGVTLNSILGIIYGVIQGGLQGAIQRSFFGAFLGLCQGFVVTGFIYLFGETQQDIQYFTTMPTIYNFIQTFIQPIPEFIKNDVERIFNKNFYNKGFNNSQINFYILTTTIVSLLTGIGIALGFNLFLIGGLLVSGLVWAKGLIYPPLKLWKLKAEYRRQESQNLIEP